MKDRFVYIVRVGQGLGLKVRRALEEKYTSVAGPILQEGGTVAALTVLTHETCEQVQAVVWNHPGLNMISCEVTALPTDGSI